MNFMLEFLRTVSERSENILKCHFEAGVTPEFSDDPEEVELLKGNMHTLDVIVQCT